MKFNIFDLLLPRETKFFTFMNDQVSNFMDGCSTFHHLVSNIEKMDEDEIRREIRKIKDCEKKGDELERNIITELNSTFITPIDREDIHLIVVNVDEALDILNDLSQKMEIYRINKVPGNVCTFADIIIDISSELVKLMNSLKAHNDVTPIIDKIHKFENEGDYLFHVSVAELFRDETSPVDIIKFKEIYEQMENVVDSVNYVAKIIRGIKIKLG